jgi:hypothetical protein
VTGRFQLAQQVVVNFLKYPGLDLAFPDLGGGFMRNVGQVYSLETLNGAATSAIIATEQQIRLAQSTSGVTRAKTESLASASLIDVTGNVSLELYEAFVRIAVQSGEGPPVAVTVDAATTVAVGGING